METTGTKTHGERGMKYRTTVLIKVGGSALTVKDSFECLQHSTLPHLSSLVNEILSRGRGCVLVHGAGSFGHFQAKEYHVSSGLPQARREEEAVKGMDSEEEKAKILGFAKTRASVTKLSNMVANHLCEESVPAVVFSPFPFIKLEEGRLLEEKVCMLYEQVLSLLEARMVPVIHGDAVLDASKAFGILSGDTIVQELAKLLKPAVVVFITDVDGILTAPPGGQDSKVIGCIGVKVKEEGGYSVLEVKGGEETQKPLKVKGSKLGHDVTGGILAKLQSCIDLAATGTQVRVVNANRYQMAVEACTKKKLTSEWIGTQVLPL